MDAPVERGGAKSGPSVTTSIEIASHRAQPAASPVQLRAAFRLASDGTALPVATDLLLAATSAVFIDTRRSVIDACAASESAIVDRLQTDLRSRGITEKTMRAIIGQANGVVDLARLAMVSGFDVPVSLGQIADQLAGPRNRAAHAGDRLDPDTARAALRTARALVGAFAPLPRPESILRHSPTERG